VVASVEARKMQIKVLENKEGIVEKAHILLDDLLSLVPSVSGEPPKNIMISH
jgi:hypothetical protein